MYVAIEGLDGSGGTTQLRRLADTVRRRLPAADIVCTREPTDGPVGRLIRAELAADVLDDAVFPYLYAADRLDHLQRVVRPARARGAWVLSDRCLASSLAYQAPVRGLPWVTALNADFEVPDLVVMLDLAPETSLARVVARGGTRDRFETLSRLVAVRDAYEAALASLAERGARVVRIDAAGSPDAVADAVEATIPWPS